MKRILIASVMTIAATSLVSAQAGKPKTAAKPAAKPATGAVLKNSVDSLSYAVGMNTAIFFKSKGITQLNQSMVSKAIDDVLKGNKTQLTEEQMNKCAMEALQKEDTKQSMAARKSGLDFLAANKNKPGVITLPSGLQYLVLKQGTGPKPNATDKVKVHYHGMLIDGTVFDSSVDRGEPIELNVNGVIPGWVEALQLMPVGSKWKLFIPSELAYGDRDAGPVIKGGSTLIFEVELLDITTGK